MAGDWIVMRIGLRDEIEVLRMSRMLGISPDEVVGKLLAVWGWFNEHTVDGFARGCDLVTVSTQARCASVTEMSRAECDKSVTDVTGLSQPRCDTFGEAMVEVGWLIVETDGVRIPNFHDWNSESAKARLKAGRRQAKSRMSRARCDKVVTDVTEMSQPRRDNRVTEAQPKKRTEEKREEEENPPTPHGRPSQKNTADAKTDRRKGDIVSTEDLPLPLKLDTDRFRDVWSEWCAYHAARGSPITQPTADRQLRKMSLLGHDRAIAAVEHSIEMGYTGLVEPGPRAKAGNTFIDNEDEQAKRDRIAAIVERLPD